MPSQKQLKAVGVTCGIGSMLLGARQAGFKILGNVEWRKYYHAKDEQGRNTFSENFKNAVFPSCLDELSDKEIRGLTGCDLAMGHPECGNFSQLNPNKASVSNPSDIPLFVDMIAKLQPRYFVMDDLPKSLIAFGIDEYAKRLPMYDLFPEWVSNFHYGNPQKQRRRMFMIGALKEEDFIFVPGEKKNLSTVQSTIEYLYKNEGEYPNHERHAQNLPCAKALHLRYYGHRATWRDLAKYVNKCRPGTTIKYYKEDGSTATRIGTYKGHWDGPAHVMTGGLSALHPLRGDPFSIRERAAIQGFPDDFVFYGVVTNRQGCWIHDKNMHLIRQTGKAMPIQFCNYVARQVVDNIRGKSWRASNERLIRSDDYINEAKMEYCRRVGYQSQDRACKACWLFDRCTVRSTTLAPTGWEPKEKKEPMSQTIAEPDSQLANKRRPKKTSIQPKLSDQQTALERVQIQKDRPNDYHCNCRYCSKFLGELRRDDGSYYSRNDRKRYYSPGEIASTKEQVGHIAKTPLHVARWAVQRYARESGFVLDPTVGAGTTLVESVTHGFDAAGIEIQTTEVAKANVRHVRQLLSNQTLGKGRVFKGDARNVRAILKKGGIDKVSLVINNPPYSGDESQRGLGKSGYEYDKKLANLAFLKEGREYWEAITDIYGVCANLLEPGGRFVVAVKDQMRNKKPDQLHERLAETLESIDLKFEGVALLKHYPGTLHLNTYHLRYGIHPPYYQTIVVFRKPKPRKARK
jgi:site-specific DNA-cytosine methylase/DNA modification methylase